MHQTACSTTPRANNVNSFGWVMQEISHPLPIRSQCLIFFWLFAALSTLLLLFHLPPPSLPSPLFPHPPPSSSKHTAYLLFMISCFMLFLSSTSFHTFLPVPLPPFFPPPPPNARILFTTFSCLLLFLSPLSSSLPLFPVSSSTPHPSLLPPPNTQHIVLYFNGRSLSALSVSHCVVLNFAGISGKSKRITTASEERDQDVATRFKALEDACKSLRRKRWQTKMEWNMHGQ